MLGLLNAPDKDIVTLKEVKAHLRLDSEEEDQYLSSLILAAIDYVERYLGRSLAELSSPHLPASIKHAVLLAVADFYENRTTATIHNPTSLQSLLGLYRVLRLI